MSKLQPFSTLPSNILGRLPSCLRGNEILNLSQTHRHAMTLFFEKRYWMHTLRDAELAGHDSPQVAYAKRRSFYLDGDSGDHGSAIEVTSFDDQAVLLDKDSGFSFDLWFRLPKVSPGADAVLLGAQSHPFTNVSWPSLRQPFARIDKNNFLYCGVLDPGLGPLNIISRLQPDKWYHLALTYESHQQNVYLNGIHLGHSAGPLRNEWGEQNHIQLGNGCFQRNAPMCNIFGTGPPVKRLNDWHGFTGYIDDFRIWDQALTKHQVDALWRGRDDIAGLTPQYHLLQQQGKANMHQVSKVKCVRPLDDALY